MLNDRMPIVYFLDRHGWCSRRRPKLRAIDHGCISLGGSVKPGRNGSCLGWKVANGSPREFSMGGRRNPVYGDAMIDHSIVHDCDVVHDRGLSENRSDFMSRQSAMSQSAISELVHSY